MSQKLYRQESSGGVYTLNPHSHYVTLPSSTIDLWMPLIGAVGVGVYALYCRLAREGRVRGSDLKRLAKAARISDNTLRSLNRTLEQIGFIAVEKPEGANRVRHYTTEIRLLEPPTRVSVELIRELECQSGYEIVAHWLVESAEAVLDTDTPPAPTLSQPHPQGGTGLDGPPQTFPQRTIPPLPQPRPQGDTSLGGALQGSPQSTIPPLPQPRPQGMSGANPSASPQTFPQRTIPPLPQPRPQGNASVGGVSQALPQRTIPPLPQPRPRGDTSLGGTPQGSSQRTIPPLPQPRPQGTGGASLGEVPAHFGNYLTNASSRLSVPSGGPVALSSVIESVYQRQIALNSAPHSAIQREPTLNSAPGSAHKRVIEAPMSATLESLILNPLESENSPPPPIQDFSQTSDPEALTSPALGEGGSRDGSA